MPARYRLASSAVDGQAVWRGDTLPGRVALCATERYRELAQAHNQPEGIITKCLRGAAWGLLRARALNGTRARRALRGWARVLDSW
jgi:hypothetical protein